MEDLKSNRHDSTYMGAILMSNKATKQECLQRNLFGLPITKAGFIKQIKVGALLFLFEYEERKLYGVFEATSDGSLNIVPNAFLSSGRNSFPAQILFRRMWMCQPLSEDEFYDAIKENYFTPKKFHFGLSYNQVFKLLELFSSRRFNVEQNQRPEIHNELIIEFERHQNEVRIAGEGMSRTLDLYGYGKAERRAKRFGGGLLQSDPITQTRSSMDMQPYQSNSQLHTSPFDANQLCACRHNLTESIFPIEHLCTERLPPIRSENHPNMYHCEFLTPPRCYDPSDPRISPLPKVPIGKEQAVHLSDFHGYPEALWQDNEYGEHPQHVCGRCAGSIPLPVINYFEGSVESPSNCHWKETYSRYSLDRKEDDERHGLSPCTAPWDEEHYPSPLKSRFRADTEQTRTSVFSRLTMGSNSRHSSRSRRTHHSPQMSETLSRGTRASLLPKRQESFQECETGDPVTSLSLDQLRGMLSHRKDQSIGAVAVKRSSIAFDKKINCEAEKGQGTGLIPLELTTVYDAIQEDPIAEESKGNSFVNFKRRSETRRLSGTVEMNVSELGLNEGTPEVCKKRKLLRPVLNQNGSKDVQDSSQDVGVQLIAGNSSINIVDGEVHPPNRLDINEKNNSASETGSHDVASDGRGKTAEGSGTGQLDAKKAHNSSSEADKGDIAACNTENSPESSKPHRREVSNRNLRWFLRKSFDDPVKVSVAGSDNAKTKDETDSK